MKTKEILDIENYFKTEDEHWNSYALEMLCEVLKQNNFKTPETPLQLFRTAIDIFSKQYATPLKAVQSLWDETDKQKLNPTQKLFLYTWVDKFLRDSIFNKADLTELKRLLKSQTERLRDQVKNQPPEYNKPLIGSLRDTLKEIMQKELEQLPKTLNDLNSVQRLNVLCKLIPYVLPKVEAVHSENGEPEHESKTSTSDFHW